MNEKMIKWKMNMLIAQTTKLLAQRDEENSPCKIMSQFAKSKTYRAVYNTESGLWKISPTELLKEYLNELEADNSL